MAGKIGVRAAPSFSMDSFEREASMCTQAVGRWLPLLSRASGLVVRARVAMRVGANRRQPGKLVT